MPNHAFISSRGITKCYGNLTAVKEVSLDISRGEFFSLLGPSGCGKTTLLRIFAGYEEMTSGTLMLDGVDIGSIPPHRRPVNMVFQNYAIFPHLNVRQNIGFGLRTEPLSRDEKEKRVDEALAMMKMETYGGRRAHEISGGQRQRVALARALVKKPKVLLLDEPLSALDKGLRIQMLDELRTLQRNVGITFIMVTHDQEEAMTMSDRFAVMSDGMVVEVGRPVDLYERPSTRFVAEFLGAANIFTGKVTEVVNGHSTIATAEVGQIKVRNSSAAIAVDKEICLAVRAENIVVSQQLPPNSTYAFRGRIVSTAYMGDRSQVVVELNGGYQLLTVMPNVQGATSRPGGLGQPVWTSWSDDAVILLP